MTREQDIYSAVDLGSFQFTPRCNPFNWRLLHGLDVDALVRLNDPARLEAVIPALQQGSIDAEGALSSHNHVQLFRLLQLAVEHLWQMRESHAKLYPAYNAAAAAADTWKAAAASYLDCGGRLLSQLQCEEGAVLTEQLLAEVAAAREALEKADAVYNTALDKLEAEDAAARCHSLRRQRLEISWRLVFGLDVQHMLITGSVSQLEQLLPQVAYGNLMAENLGSLTPAHFRQLLQLGQACLDYLHAICCATSKVLEQQVQQLATGSAPIPELTTACEELRTALTASLSSSIRVLKADAAPASPVRTVRGLQASVKASAAAACHSPRCHHVAHLEMTGHQGGGACGSMGSPRCCNVPPSPSACCHTLRRGCGQCGGSSSAVCCCSGVYACSGAAAASGRAECSALLSGRLFYVGLTPAANRLQLRMDQLDQDLRHERECTQGMRQALEEITDMLQDLPSPSHQHQQQQQQHKQASPRPTHKQQQLQQQQLQPHTVNVPVNISLSGEGARGQMQEAPGPPSPAGVKDPSGAVRVLINEDTIRARERSAAGQQLSEHISDIITSHHGLLARRSRSPQASSSGGRTQTREGVALPGGGAGGPFVTVRSIPSSSGGRLWRTADYSAAGAAAGFEVAEGAGEFVSGPVRGWQRSGGSPSRTTHSFDSRQGVWAAEEAIAVAQSGMTVVTQRGPADGGLQQREAGGGQGLGDFMNQQLQLQAQPQQQRPSGAAVGQGGAGSAAADAGEQQQTGLGAAAAAAPEDPAKRVQQQLFKEAAAGGFGKLLRSMSPKNVFRPSSAGKGSSPGTPATATCTSGAAGELQWPLLVPAAGSLASSPEAGAPSRSGRSFTATAAARAAEELGSATARRPLTPPGQFSPLKASIVAHTG